MELAIGLWILCGVAGAMIGAKKGEGCGGAMIGLLLGPVGLLIVALSKGHRKECPYCRELVHKKALICPHCRKDLGERKADARREKLSGGIAARRNEFGELELINPEDES